MDEILGCMGGLGRYSQPKTRDKTQSLLLYEVQKLQGGKDDRPKTHRQSKTLNPKPLSPHAQTHPDHQLQGSP